MLQRVAVCYSVRGTGCFLNVLQRVAACCSVLQCDACSVVCCSVLQCDRYLLFSSTCCSVLQCAECSVLQHVAVREVPAVFLSVLQCVTACCSVLHVVCCSVLQCEKYWLFSSVCVAVCCSVLQCAACSVLQRVAVREVPAVFLSQ